MTDLPASQLPASVFGALVIPAILSAYVTRLARPGLYPLKRSLGLITCCTEWLVRIGLECDLCIQVSSLELTGLGLFFRAEVGRR